MLLIEICTLWPYLRVTTDMKGTARFKPS